MNTTNFCPGCGGLIEDRPEFTVVTPEQRARGYRVKLGAFVYARRFAVVRKLDDGNYEVRTPDPHGECRS